MVDPNDSPFPKTLADLRVADHSLVDTSGTADKNIYKTLNLLRKSTLSVPNRLHSILQDAKFVASLHSYLNERTASDTTCASVNPSSARSPHLSFPLVANERCGSWYIPPHLRQHNDSLTAPHNESNPIESASSSAYFKSTDGHVNQWSFSLRRLNLPLLSVLGAHRGAILVDSTRRGKAYPDALRRTVPIWVAVWNRVLFPEEQFSWSWNLQVKDLERGEVAQVEQRLNGFVDGLRGLELDLLRLKASVMRPIVCVWIANCEQEEWIWTFEGLKAQVERVKEMTSGECNVLVLCSASRRVVGSEMSENGYIQGAGDDSEGWARGLTAQIFWRHKDEIVETRDEEIEEVIERLVRAQKPKVGAGEAVLVKPTQNLFICVACEGTSENDGIAINCNGPREQSSSTTLMLGCRQGKLGSRDLRDRLVLVKDFISQMLSKGRTGSVVVFCSTGRDLSAGVVLAILCLFYEADGHLKPRSKVDADRETVESLNPLAANAGIDKQLIKQRLAWITTSKPDVNPSRSTLQAVNSFLMERPP